MTCSFTLSDLFFFRLFSFLIPRVLGNRLLPLRYVDRNVKVSVAVLSQPGGFLINCSLLPRGTKSVYVELPSLIVPGVL